MTELTEAPRCRWCRRPIAPRPGRGRPREFCRRSCRQRDYESRRRAAELGLSDHDVIVARRELETLGDRLYVLEAAIEDVEGDLDRATTMDDYRAAVNWLLDAARGVLAVRP